MSKYSAMVLALGLGLGSQVSAAQFSFDLSGLGAGLLSSVALDGAFSYDTITQEFGALNISTDAASYGLGSGALASESTDRDALFWFTASGATLLMDITGFNPESTDLASGESQTFEASATQGAASTISEFDLEGFPVDIFGGTIFVTNTSVDTGTVVVTPPTGRPVTPTPPLGRPAVVPAVDPLPASVPLPASLPLAVFGLATLGWFSRRKS